MRQVAVAAVAVAAASLGLLAQPATAQSPNDREIAKAGVFQADDFPAGWRATPDKKSKSDPNDCPTLKNVAGKTRKSKTADVDSDDFKRQDDQYSSGVVVYRTEDVARRVYDAFASRAVRRCLTRLVKNVVEKEDFDDVKVESGTVTGTGSYGDESSDIALTITASNGGFEQERFADAVFVRVGRALAAYIRDSTSEPSEFDEPTFDGLITSATDRLITATGGQPTTDTSQPR